MISVSAYNLYMCFS